MTSGGANGGVCPNENGYTWHTYTTDDSAPWTTVYGLTIHCDGTLASPCVCATAALANAESVVPNSMGTFQVLPGVQSGASASCQVSS